MKDSRPMLSIIIPVYNEQRTVAALLERVSQAPYPQKELLVVDDGSTDGTAAILDSWRDRPGVRIFRHARNQGKGAAVRTALAQARGAMTLIQDADLEYDPDDYPRLVEAARQAGRAAVYGSRYLRPAQPLPWTRFRCAVALLNLLVRILYGQRLTDEATCYKLLPTELFRALDLQAQRFELCAEMTAKLCRLGVPIVEVPIRYTPRGYQEGKKIGWVDAWTTLGTLLRWRIGRFPLRLARRPEEASPMKTLPISHLLTQWLRATAPLFCVLLATGCGKSDDKQFKEAVQKVASGETDSVDARSFPKIADQELAALADASNLKSLNLDESRITDEGLKKLPWMPKLTDLSLSNTQITDAGLEGLTRLTNLQFLRLDRTRVKNPGLSTIAGLANLKNLSLWKCVIDDQGVASLAALHHLERLSLDETQVTDAGLKHLTALSRLQYLSLWNTKVSDSGVNDLQKARPRLKVNR